MLKAIDKHRNAESGRQAVRFLLLFSPFCVLFFSSCCLLFLQIKKGADWVLTVALLALAGGSIYFIVKELFPGKMAPNNIFNRAVDDLRDSAEVKQAFGNDFKAYGKDHGGKREGRRNFIEHYEYKSDSGSQRVRVRFNIKSSKVGLVFAEVDEGFDDWVYLMVQDSRTGKVITLKDNRALMQAKSANEREAFSALLGK